MSPHARHPSLESPYAGDYRQPSFYKEEHELLSGDAADRGAELAANLQRPGPVCLGELVEIEVPETVYAILSHIPGRLLKLDLSWSAGAAEHLVPRPPPRPDSPARGLPEGGIQGPILRGSVGSLLALLAATLQGAGPTMIAGLSIPATDRVLTTVRYEHARDGAVALYFELAWLRHRAIFPGQPIRALFV